MRKNPHYSIVGDVNLDGNVSGTGSGPAASDDVTAFIQGIDGLGSQYLGWGYDNGTGAATITSWKNGDIAHPDTVGSCFAPLGGGLCAGGDGKTDLYDFLALRNAINDPMGVSALNQFFLSLDGSGGAVPEPSALALAFVGLLIGAFSRRRQFRR
jgi:hypothetical protein